MKLVLLRHADRDEKDKLHPQEPTALGRAQCLEVGRQLAEAGFRPQRVLISKEDRTRRTAELILEAMGQTAPIDEQRFTSSTFGNILDVGAWLDGVRAMGVDTLAIGHGYIHKPMRALGIDVHSKSLGRASGALIELEGGAPVVTRIEPPQE